jgi:hypothetical protein
MELKDCSSVGSLIRSREQTVSSPTQGGNRRDFDKLRTRERSMSTKSTIAYGRNFHLYHEALDEDYVYLELEGTKFEASYNRVMVPIPVHVWEVIRRYPGVDLKYADKTDVEIRRYVEREVDERLKRYEEADKRSKGIVSLAGSLVFGTADQPRDRQIAAGVEYFTQVREHQRQIKQAIEELEQANAKDKKGESF